MLLGKIEGVGEKLLRMRWWIGWHLEAQWAWFEQIQEFDGQESWDFPKS